jgi:hypothetical protein
VLSGYFSLPPGAQHTVTFTYRLPPQIQLASYALVVRRQSGIGPLPLEVTAGAHHLATVVREGHKIWSPQ